MAPVTPHTPDGDGKMITIITNSVFGGVALFILIGLCLCNCVGRRNAAHSDRRCVDKMNRLQDGEQMSRCAGIWGVRKHQRQSACHHPPPENTECIPLRSHRGCNRRGEDRSIDASCGPAPLPLPVARLPSRGVLQRHAARHSPTPSWSTTAGSVTTLVASQAHSISGSTLVNPDDNEDIGFDTESGTGRLINQQEGVGLGTRRSRSPFQPYPRTYTPEPNPFADELPGCSATPHIAPQHSG